MKKLFLLLLILLFFSLPAYAQGEIFFSGEDVSERYDVSAYIPEEVKRILMNNGIAVEDEIKDVDFISFVTVYIKSSLTKYGRLLFGALSAIVLFAVFGNINDNINSKMIFGFIFSLVISIYLVSVIGTALEGCNELISSVKELLNVLLPSFTAVTLLGGGVLTAAIEASSFAAVIAFLEFLVTGVLTALVAIMTIFSLFERFSAPLKDMALSRSVKKYSMIVLTFITTVMLTVLSFQHIISARADSIATRSVKFASSSFIPLIGNAVGEAMRTVSQGASYLKSSVGYSSSIALFLWIFPYICDLIALKLLLSFLSFASGSIGNSYASDTIDTTISSVDFLLAIIICVFILSFLLVYLFSSVSFGI